MWDRLKELCSGYMNRQLLGVGALLLLILSFWLGGQYENWQSRRLSLKDIDDAQTLPTSTEPVSEKQQANERPMVHVAGAVEHPGVYEADSDDRVNDVLQQAGVAADADTNQLNLAQRVIDGDKIVVPRQGEATSTPQTPTVTTGGAGVSSNGKVSLNRADKSDLMELPGVGEVRADAILTYRQEHGGFKSVEELKNVSGIGDKTYAQLEGHVSL